MLETILERTFICGIWKEQKYQNSFVSHSNKIPPWCHKSSTFTHCFKYWVRLMFWCIGIVLCHFSNCSSHIQGIYSCQSYILVGHSESFRINIAIVAMRRLADRVWDVSNSFPNTNVPIHDILCVSPTPYYL